MLRARRLPGVPKLSDSLRLATKGGGPGEEGLRLHPGKKEVRAFDYVDRAVPKLRRMFEKRLRGYRAIGYAESEVPEGFELLSEQWPADWDGIEDEG